MPISRLDSSSRKSTDPGHARHEGQTAKGLIYLLLAAPLLVALPLAGVWLAGLPVSRYFEFPPLTSYVQHAPFSWAISSGYALFISLSVLPFGVSWARAKAETRASPCRSRPVPWWGWLSVTLGAMAWLLAWNRFTWFAPLQPHTFTPLWISYILTGNALTYARTGTCLLLDRPGYLLALFPLSAFFWWFFEYLNRYAQNWYYVGVSYSPLESLSDNHQPERDEISPP
ncbi:hypothetical protein ACFL0Q_06775, partial [Thermodesulfobacteriota bacterium]